MASCAPQRRYRGDIGRYKGDMARYREMTHRAPNTIVDQRCPWLGLRIRVRVRARG